MGDQRNIFVGISRHVDKVRCRAHAREPFHKSREAREVESTILRAVCVHALRDVKDLRVVEADNPPGPFGLSTRNPFGFGGGPFAFDYGSKTVRFGTGLEVAEAKYWRAKLLAAKPSLESR